MVGHVVVYLRPRHEHAVGLDEFLALGVIGIAYGVAQLCDASGFLAVFALDSHSSECKICPDAVRSPWALLRAPWDMNMKRSQRIRITPAR